MAFGHCAAKCPPCPKEPELRKRLGCDGDGRLQVACSCGGGRGRSCGACEDGWLAVEKCPAHLPPEVTAVHEAYGHYRNGFLPVAGGMLDQAMPFVSAMRMLDRLYARHEEIDLDRGR